MKNLVDMMDSTIDEFIAIRRDLHAHPEIGFDEHRTSDIVAQKLASWGYDVHRGLAQTGVVGTLKVGNGTKRIGIRADMDALPMDENSGKPWQSLTQGRFHGCGHDGHTAILLCAAKYLAETKNFDGILHVIFQPAEELLYGGKVMVDDGLFDRFPCDIIFGMHNMPAMKTGEFYFREGAMMASSDTLHIEVQGVGAHGAMPERGIDAALIACHIACALQTIISRNVPALEPAVLTIGSIQSGQAPNIINASALMKLSLRALNNDVRRLMLRRVTEIATAQASSFGATVNIEHINGSPALMNGQAATEFAVNVAKSLVGPDKVHENIAPFMGSEDFAFMLESNPNGCYMIIGNGDEPGFCNVHNPGYDFNDDCILPAAAYWVALTQSYLK